MLIRDLLSFCSICAGANSGFASTAYFITELEILLLLLLMYFRLVLLQLLLLHLMLLVMIPVHLKLLLKMHSRLLLLVLQILRGEMILVMRCVVAYHSYSIDNCTAVTVTSSACIRSFFPCRSTTVMQSN
jgi:hypothetical protein